VTSLYSKKVFGDDIENKALSIIMMSKYSDNATNIQYDSTIARV